MNFITAEDLEESGGLSGMQRNIKYVYECEYVFVKQGTYIYVYVYTYVACGVLQQG